MDIETADGSGAEMYRVCLAHSPFPSIAAAWKANPVVPHPITRLVRKGKHGICQDLEVEKRTRQPHPFHPNEGKSRRTGERSQMSQISILGPEGV